jgi:hypothetical protein
MVLFISLASSLSLPLPLSLSAEATFTGSIYLERAVAVSMTALSFRGNSKHSYPSTNASLFHQIKVFETI